VSKNLAHFHACSSIGWYSKNYLSLRIGRFYTTALRGVFRSQPLLATMEVRRTRVFGRQVRGNSSCTYQEILCRQHSVN
jgi:hypothetical protein